VVRVEIAMVAPQLENRQVCLVSWTLDRPVCYCQAMVTKAPARASARERLLDAATELFYEEGGHTVGIDRVIDRAGVAKATLYSTFGSKEGLIQEYLRGRHAVRRATLLDGV